MDLELLTYVCAGFTLIALVGNVLAFLYRHQIKARKHDVEAGELARRHGLDRQGRVITGRIGEVEVRAAPSKVTVRRVGASGPAKIPSQLVEVDCDRGEEWMLCRKSEVDRLENPPSLHGVEKVGTGIPEIDEKYVFLSSEGPAFAFWQDPLMCKALFDLNLVVAVARGGKLRAWYKPPRLTDAFVDVVRLERALFTAVAMTSENHTLLHRPKLEGPLPSVEIWDPVKWSALAGLAGGAITAQLWRRPEWEIWDGPGQTWQGMALGYTFTFVPVVLLLLVVRALRARAGKGPAAGGESSGTPYR